MTDPNLPPRDFDEEDELTEREALFVAEYLIDQNATGAARRMGYTGPAASAAAYNFKTRKRVKAAIQQALIDMRAEAGLTAERVVQELMAIGFSNIGHYLTKGGHLDAGKATEAQLAAVQEYTTKIEMQGKGEEAQPIEVVKLKLHGKMPALEKLSKLVGLADPPQQVDITSSDGSFRRELTLEELKEQAIARGLPTTVFDNEGEG